MAKQASFALVTCCALLDEPEADCRPCDPQRRPGPPHAQRPPRLRHSPRQATCRRLDCGRHWLPSPRLLQHQAGCAANRRTAMASQVPRRRACAHANICVPFGLLAGDATWRVYCISALLSEDSAEWPGAVLDARVLLPPADKPSLTVPDLFAVLQAADRVTVHALTNPVTNARAIEVRQAPAALTLSSRQRASPACRGPQPAKPVTAQSPACLLRWPICFPHVRRLTSLSPSTSPHPCCPSSYPRPCSFQGA